MTEPASTSGEYVYKVLVNQSTREYRHVRARSIAEAERQGIVVILVGPADDGIVAGGP